ncbi:MAG TPA: hypothetical protein VG458_10880, partial [Solirubrobacterales bacterium]|nr:hypothetical protein [Solirubrobacterales bacterium]
ALDNPEDGALDALGRILVADTDNNRISVFDADGKFLAAFGKGVNASDGKDICDATSGCLAGAASDVAGALGAPRGLAVETLVYVADTGNNRISVFNPELQFVGAIGEEVAPGGGDNCTVVSGCQGGGAGTALGEMNEPTDLAFAPGNRLAVANTRATAGSTSWMGKRASCGLSEPGSTPGTAATSARS